MRQVTLLARCSKQWKIIDRVVAFADEGWSFTRGSNYRALSQKILVFWIVFTYGRAIVVNGGSTIF